MPALTQAVPEPVRVLSELCRICKSGGWVHVLSEDYGMVHMLVGAFDVDRLWHDGVFAADGERQQAVEHVPLGGPAPEVTVEAYLHTRRGAGRPSGGLITAPTSAHRTRAV